MLRTSGDVGAEQFPNQIDTPAGTFPLSYHFEPGHPADGVTLTIPLAVLNQLDADRLDWLVPGLIEERCLDLIKTLPKQVRVNVVPAPDYAAKAVRIMPFGVGNLNAALAAALGKLTGLTIRPDDFVPSQLQDYLRMNVVVIDEQNKFVASGRDIHELRNRLRDKLRELVAKQVDPRWHRDGLTTWDVGDLPDRVELKTKQGTVQAFPGLIELDGKAGLRLFDTPQNARTNTRHGVRRLFTIEYAKELAWHVTNIPGFQTMALQYAPIASAVAPNVAGSGRTEVRPPKEASAVGASTDRESAPVLRWAEPQPAKSNASKPSSVASTLLKHQLIEALAHQLITPDAADVRTRMEYELQLRGAWNRLTGESKRLAGIAGPALAEFQQAMVTLATKKFPPLLQASVDDIRAQLKWLMPADFLLSTPKEWLPHLPRFVKAVNVRLDKLLNAGLKRDVDGLLLVSPHWQNYLDLRATLPKDQPEPEPLTRYRWLLEEYRVSMFAQNLGTSLPISGKRLESLWEEIVGRKPA
ncbi:MAG: DUF3418 domain-containing protein [Tepidisphaeraceae bacterium]